MPLFQDITLKLAKRKRRGYVCGKREYMAYAEKMKLKIRHNKKNGYIVTYYGIGKYQGICKYKLLTGLKGWGMNTFFAMHCK